jgi:hypothetical protein
MRRDPAAVFWLAIVAVGLTALVAGIGVLVANGQAKEPSENWYWVGRILVGAGAIVALLAVAGLVILALEHKGIHLRLRWPIRLQWPIYRTRDGIAQANPARPAPEPQLRESTDASAPKRQVKTAETTLKQRGELTLPGEVSRFTPQILACIDAIIADSPIPERTWYINDKLGDHHSDSLPALLDKVIWETVTWVHLLTGAIPGGTLAPGQTAALSLSSGLKEAEIWWTDPSLGPALQLTAYRIEQCFASGRAAS